jgi:hypothetical protein
MEPVAEGGQIRWPDGLKLNESPQHKFTQRPDHVAAVEQVQLVRAQQNVPADTFIRDGL